MYRQGSFPVVGGVFRKRSRCASLPHRPRRGENMEMPQRRNRTNATSCKLLLLVDKSPSVV